MEEKSYSEATTDIVKSFLREHSWIYYFNNERGILHFNISAGKNIKLGYNIYIGEEEDYTLYATLQTLNGDPEDEDMMARLAEFITRINHEIKQGGFLCDYRDGEILYKVYQGFQGTSLTSEVLNNSILCPAAMFNHYTAGFHGIVNNKMSAVDAIKFCDQPIKRRKYRHPEIELIKANEDS